MVALEALPATDGPRARGPLTPAEELASFRLTPGLRIELVAAEPDVQSPVAMAFDEDGRLWVVEMPDYPTGPPKGQPPGGRVCVLEDKDGSGRYRKTAVFADGLLFANGILPWRGGAVVTAAPHIIFLEDTKKGLKADRREVLYEGFAVENPQLRVSCPVLGLDGWVYVANGLRGGMVKRAGRPGATTINISGRDFRFDLVHDRGEATSGMGQYGNSFDAWGQRFVCDNRHHLRHIVLDDRYIRRNPFLALPEVVEDPSELEPGPLFSGGRVYPISSNWTTSNLHAGRFTSACGILLNNGDRVDVYHRSAFTCEPAGNLVHQEVLRPNGASFLSRPARRGVEFLASPDDWFRPVFLTDGPDGALYVVDMYRAVIEHPEFMPPELKQRPDLFLGKDKGRIWRITVKHPERPLSVGPPRPPLPRRVGKASTAELMRLLGHPGGWQRTTAQRLLLERQDRAAIGPLQQICLTWHDPLAIIHAAWLLQSFGALDVDIVRALLANNEPHVREHAARLAEPYLASSALVRDRLISLAVDDDPRVRFQAALSLGEWDDDRILGPLARIALADAADPWARRAVASAVPRRAGALIAALFRVRPGLLDKPWHFRLALFRELAALVGARGDTAEVADLLEALYGLAGAERTRWQLTGLAGLTDGMGRRGVQLTTFFAMLPATRKQTVAHAADLLRQAGAIAADGKADNADRLLAIGLLAHAEWTAVRPVFERLLAEGAQDVRLAAVRAMAAHLRPDVSELLLNDWRSQTPALRREVIEALVRQPDRILALLAAVESGTVRPSDLDPQRIQQLMAHPRSDVRDRARKLLARGLPADRKEVLARYQEALKRKGDPRRGQAVFQKNCATCHRVAGIGVDVGPDISDTRTKTPEQILLDVLDPNAAIDNNYINYTVTTRSGKTLTGIIVAETASSVTLRRAEGQSDVVLRQDIEEIVSTGVSLMPEGLEKMVSIDDMADLIGFLKNWRYLDGKVPLGP
jgi:putative membrane-bound dehydrogenase-like protein